MGLKVLKELCDKCYSRRETDKENAEMEDEFYTGGVFEKAGPNDVMSAQEKMLPGAKSTVEQERNRLVALEYAFNNHTEIPVFAWFIRSCGKKCDTARYFLLPGQKK